ncbi:hypothetical protein C8J57DRAFT_1087158, partial [Mycena rebaudengoi]
ASSEILNKQCLLRAPHFTIYQPQLTWIVSIANRAICAALGALLYGFAPGTFDSVHVALPAGVKYAGKAPFAFHDLNGVRHLSWDMTKCDSVRFHGTFFGWCSLLCRWTLSVFCSQSIARESLLRTTAFKP